MSETLIQYGLTVARKFTTGGPGKSPFDDVKWVTRDALITDAKGETVFEQKNVQVPEDWSQTALNIVASKYFHGAGDERENSVMALILRVVTTITNQGMNAGYFKTKEDASAFMDELIFLLVNQYVAFNSPVWFNVGLHTREPENKSENWHWNSADRVVEYTGTGYKNPQCSACFINSVEDSMKSILKLVDTEGMLFKYGSGTGSNLSAIRGSNEALSGGGIASGPLSFMRGFDAFAGVIKSGGKTRRAAKMVILDADHPDIEEFITCKGKEEEKAKALVREGYDGSGPDSEAYKSIFFQNANNSVRVTDEFMQAAVEGKDWNLIARKGGHVTKTVKAADLLRQIAEETWRCGDPGMQFDTTINKWHTSKETGRINASNPCSEYMFLDNTACNLASFNLVKFLRANGTFDIEAYKAAVWVLIIAMDILVDLASYPTEKIARNSHDFRPLGLGYANLGTLLMLLGLAYDSDEGRNYAASLTALMTGTAYKASAELAASLAPLAPAQDFAFTPKGGAFPGFAVNEEYFREVMRLHYEAAANLAKRYDSPVSAAAEEVWDDVAYQPLKTWAGYRNSQVSVLAPTGTIGFMMDCDTTGIEPDTALVKYKKMVGGGMLKLVNSSIAPALRNLGYSDDQVMAIVAYMDETGTIEGAPELRDEHLHIFDCAFRAAKGKRSIRWQGHVDMMAAVQPFLSGAISKTVNLPKEATVDDVADAYIDAWRKGLKAIAIYRDGSKGTQPLNTSMDSKKDEVKKKDDMPAVVTVPVVEATQDLNAPPRAVRHRLPIERASVTHKFNIGGYEGYVTVGLFPNGQPGELFLRMSKEGSTVSGLMDGIATQISLSLQHGVPLKDITAKMKHTRFEPSGWTGNEEFGFATSLLDYLGRWLDARFGEGKQLDLFNNHATNGAAASAVAPAAPAVAVKEEKSLTERLVFGDAPMCSNCGSQMVPNGACHKCENCGGTSGCS